VPGRRHVGELADGLGDPVPCRLTAEIVVCDEFVGARDAFLAFGTRWIWELSEVIACLQLRAREPEWWRVGPA
jgi:hypothetical protein